MTKTQKTKDNYFKRAKHLLNKFEAEKKIKWETNPMLLIDWINLKKTEWSFSTTKQYIYSLIYFMEQKGPIEIVKALKKIEYNKSSSKTTDKKTSSIRQKHITNHEYSQIVNAFSTSKSDYAELTALWIKSMMLTGVRTCEWVNAVYKDNHLIVKNAKNTNERASGEYRTFNLEKIKPQDKETITRFMTLFRELLMEKDFQTIYSSCQKLLNRTTRKIWPNRKKYPTLYSGRHQFSSNIKSSNLSKEEVALAMGHASDKTAFLYYGKPKHGDGEKVMIKIDKSNASKVRHKKSFLDNIEKPKKTNQAKNTGVAG